MELKTANEPVDAWHMTDDLHAETGKGDPFAAAIRATRMPMIITDPRRPDNPIVFANDAFLRLSGYERDEVVGRNCRFLQGPDTDPRSVERLRDAIGTRTAISIDILNYRKDGTSFWNALYLSPVTNEEGELQFYFASQVDVTERKNAEHSLEIEKQRFESAVRARTRELEAAIEAQETLLHEVDHRVKNNLQMISSLIVMQSRTIEDQAVKASLRAMLERIEAVSTVHRRLYQSKDVSRFDVSDFVRDLVTDLLGATGRDDIKAILDLEPVVISADKATPMALMINELVTNAIKHGFSSPKAAPRIGVSLKQSGSQITVEVTDNGKGMPVGGADASFGMKLVRSLGRQLQGTIEWQDAAPGTLVRLLIPAGQDRPDA